MFYCVCFKNLETQRLHEARYNGQTRNSCSESGLTHTKIRFSENGNVLMHTLSEPLSGSNDISFRNIPSKFRKEML